MGVATLLTTSHVHVHVHVPVRSMIVRSGPCHGRGLNQYTSSVVYSILGITPYNSTMTSEALVLPLLLLLLLVLDDERMPTVDSVPLPLADLQISISREVVTWNASINGVIAIS